MIRLFPQHRVRAVETLDGTWRHTFPASGTAIRPGGTGEAVDLEVPGAWEAASPRRAAYRGEALIERDIQLAAAGPVLLRFAGVSHTACVLVDGVPVAAHHGAYTAFEATLPHLATGTHRLCLHVSNAFGAASGVHIPNDYYTYGGIIRPVELHRLADPLHLRRADLERCERTAGGWRIGLRVRLGSLADGVRRARVRVRLGGIAAEADSGPVPPGGADLAFRLDLPDLPAWSPATPHLHELAVELLDGEGAAFDDWRDRLGLRTVAFGAGGLEVNGEPVRLLGVCRHEDHAEHGCALGVAAMRRDLELIRALGANAVRTTHYPNDERLLDLCDEAGILVWEEGHARGQKIEAMRHPRFREQAFASVREMVAQHRNHPSIAIWGALNECASEHAEGRPVYAEQLAWIAAEDPTRPRAYASDAQRGDLCLDLADIPAWNLYPRWYEAGMAPAGMLDAVLDAHAGAVGGRPVIISETGAGGIPGWHDPIGRSLWSEERQADIVGEQLAGFLAHPRVCGVFLWQFCDCRVSEEEWALRRPRCINDKGIVDRHRTPKLAYAAVRAAFVRAAGLPAHNDGLG